MELWVSDELETLDEVRDAVRKAGFYRFLDKRTD